MSYLAIGSVTKAIAELLTRKLNKPQLMGTSSFRVTALPPDDDRVSDADGLNLFLYRVTESPFAKNVDWPGDRFNPAKVKRPPLALNLHYLLTAFVKKTAGSAQDDITAQQLLGNAMVILHEFPVLNDIHDGDFDSSLDTQFPPELRNSFEKTKIMMSPISMEEFSKIWTGLSKAYRLSVAYEVALVQIAPFSFPAAPGALVQELGLQVVTIESPFIASVEPSAGPADAQVVIRGKGFKTRGAATTVTISDTILTEADFSMLTADQIVLSIPQTVQQGPMLRIVVSVAGRDSASAYYEVRPWIRLIKPMRGFPGLPIAIPFEIPPGSTASLQVDGIVAPITVDAQNKLIVANVPAAIASNGPKPVVLTLGPGTPQNSNVRFFEVLPQIQSVAIATSVGPTKTTITVTGQRLNGKDVRVKYGNLLLNRGENINATQVSVEVDRLLSLGQPVYVLVDGRQSNTIPPKLDSIDPLQAFSGDTVALTGNSLSGQNVIVSFGAMSVNLGPNAYSSRLTVRVPSGLAVGPVNVKVSVDGNDTNSLVLDVLG
jgi:hypothetical protein